jgi:anti-sigma factor RsiW
MTARRWLPWRRRPASPPRELECVEIVELVTEYVEGALSAADGVRFEAHIAGCEPCSAYLEQMRITVLLAGHLQPDELEPEVERGLLDAFRHWKAGGG